MGELPRKWERTTHRTVKGACRRVIMQTSACVIGRQAKLFQDPTGATEPTGDSSRI